jgi:hypothetical protein
MSEEIGTVATQFLLWKYLFRIFGFVSLQCYWRFCLYWCTSAIAAVPAVVYVPYVPVILADALIYSAVANVLLYVRSLLKSLLC